MTALSTHDTKRGEDVRARIAVLAEVPGPSGRRRSTRCSAWRRCPTPGFANLLWQAAFGAWPISTDRLHAYAEKAMREAGEHTTWTDPDEDLRVGRARRRRRRRRRRRVRRGARATWSRGSSRPRAATPWPLKLLALTIPGVPDVYQGSEVERAQPGRPGQPATGRLRRRRSPTPRPTAPVEKQRAHAARRCGCGATGPSCSRATPRCRAEGPAADHVLAFDRGGAVTVVTRLPRRARGEGRLGRHHVAAGGRWPDVVSRRSPRRVDADPARRPARRAAGAGGPMTAGGSTCGRRTRSGSGCRSATRSSR